MILTKSDFLAMGFKVSDDESLELAIREAEMYYIKDILTDEIYIRCQTEQTSEMEIILNGGTIGNKVYAGLKYAIAHISFAFLLRQNVNATRMGSVMKASEYSDQADSETLFEVIRHNIALGKAALREICEYFSVDPDRTTNNAFGLLW